MTFYDKYYLESSKQFNLSAFEEIRVDLDLVIIYGVVRDSFNDRFIDRAKITLLNIRRNWITAITHTNSKGQYLIYNLLPDKYVLYARHYNYMIARAASLRIDNSEHVQNNLYLTLDKYQNYEIQDIQMTNQEGMYLFPHVVPGRYVIKAKLYNGTEVQETIELTE